MDLTDGDHTLIATLGPAGGERGYQAITGTVIITDFFSFVRLQIMY